MSISPKLRVLSCHAWEFMGLWGSSWIFREQIIESWLGFYGQNATRLSTETLLSGSKLVQTIATSGLASVIRKRTKATFCKLRQAFRVAVGHRDRLLQHAKPWRKESSGKVEKRVRYPAKWASDQFEGAHRAFSAS